VTPLRNWSDLTVTDVFCGAGGNTIGAKKAGLRVRVGLNHWARAIETYGTNNPEVDVVERVDVSLCDPRRYPSTDIGIFSPECTTHSPAGGGRHKATGPTLFDSGKPLDPATVRSRVTMFDVVRFAEYHRYRIVVIENVVEATRWELFPDWLRMMDNLGYNHRILSFNSMFFHPTPQSRDRIYVVFWRKGNREPNLVYRPAAPCAKCGNVEAVQAWNPSRSVGKYRRQYRYVCSRCAGEVTPFYFAALNALDFSLKADRISDRERPLKPRTMERIRYGLKTFGGRHLIVQTNMTSRLASRVRTAEMHAMPTQPASVHHALVQPGFLVETAQTHDGERRSTDLTKAIPPLTGQQTSALVSPMIISAGSRDSMAPATNPMPAQTGSERLGVVTPFMVTLRTHSDAQAMTDAAPSVCASGNHQAVVQGSPFIVPVQGDAVPRCAADALPTQLAECAHDFVVSGAAQISLRDANAMRVAGLEREFMTQGCAPQSALIQPTPFLVSYFDKVPILPPPVAHSARSRRCCS
jgi:DNA (cytosine-5)-methyltransferase 1